jgi:hypothetical protein
MGGQAAAFRPIGVVAGKSPGLAVFLSIWLGGGHLYAGQTVLGIGMLFFHFLLVLLLITGIGAIIAIPLWFVCFPIAAVTASNACKEFNRRNGIIVN